MSQSKFYTGRGDDGYTGLLGPERVPKYDPRPEAYGTVDEVQAAMGLARASGCGQRTGEILLEVQQNLHPMMAELAAAGQADSPFAGSIGSGHVEQLEAWIDELERETTMPREFVVPGDSYPGAALHLARTVTRRAERLTIRLVHKELLANDQIARYLNRLSSLLMVLAHYDDRAATSQAPALVREEQG